MIRGRRGQAGHLDGRAAAVVAVTDALRGENFVSQTLRRLRALGRLEPREAALATEVGLGAIRHLITIEHVLSRVARYDRRRTDATVRALLSTAAYQIIWLDRIPVYAAVDQAVELASRQVSRRAATMVNAVLRRLSGAIVARSVPWERLNAAQIRRTWDRACLFQQAVLPPPDESDANVRHLAAATSERTRRYRELATRYGPEQAEQVAWASQAVPVTVVHRNPKRIGTEEFAASLRDLADQEIELAGGVAYVPATVNVVDTPLFAMGQAFVQDTTAHLAAEALEARPGERVLDLCAAPGGKSVALALAMQDCGLVLACDLDPERLAQVDENAARLGLSSIRTCPIPAGTEAELERDPFDAALVDVPCSNTGVVARRPEARFGFTVRKLHSLITVQHALLRKAARCVRAGGRLVYSTCSLEPGENEAVVAAFRAEHPHWRLVREQTILPNWGPRPSDWRDGGYYAVLRHAGS